MKTVHKVIVLGKNSFFILPMNKILKILLIILGVIIFSNLAFLDWLTIKNFKSNSPVVDKKANLFEDNVLIDEGKVATDSCGLVCQKTIQEKIAEELGNLPLSAGQSSVSPSAPKNIQPTNGKPKIIYIPLVAEGSSVLTDWTNIMPSEFYFDLDNYPTAKEVRFEAYLLALNGSAKVYGRIYDATNFRGVDNSEMSTQSDSFVRLESTAISIWRGNNKYTVQLKSANGTEVQLKDAKLKIYY